MAREADDERHAYLGAPSDSTGWQYGQAGSVGADLRIDCWLDVRDATIQRARFEVFAGEQTRCAALALAQWLEGRDLEQARAVNGLDIAAMADMADEARSQALCIEDALQAAMNATRTDRR